MKKKTIILILFALLSLNIVHSQIYNVQYSFSGTYCSVSNSNNGSQSCQLWDPVYTVYGENGVITPIDGNNNYDEFPVKVTAYRIRNCTNYGPGGTSTSQCQIYDEVNFPNLGAPCEYVYNNLSNNGYLVVKLSVPSLTLRVPSNNNICTYESLSVFAHNCHNLDFNYKYSINGGVTFQYLGSVFPSDLTTFLPSGYTGNLFIKADISYDGGVTYPNQTNIIIYNVITCSPQLLSFTPIDTQCSYSSDGGFTAYFERSLNTGEVLIMSLWVINYSGSLILVGQTNPAITTLGVNNSYEWHNQVSTGRYIVRYQTLISGTYSSLESSSVFTIGNPPPITFSATKQNDVYCNGGSDAAIQLNASGGVGNFKYELNNNGVWVPFTTTTTHTITGLPKGSKTIKVQDGNGCTQR